MKKCTACKAIKSVSDFNKNKAKSDGLNNICRECSNKRSRQYYAENTEHHKANVVDRKWAAIAANQSRYLTYLSEHPCCDCGNTDIRVLEADHLHSKYKNVSDMLSTGSSWSRILTELAKCDIVCANCHRIRTQLRRPSYRITTPDLKL